MHPENFVVVPAEFAIIRGAKDERYNSKHNDIPPGRNRHFRNRELRNRIHLRFSTAERRVAVLDQHGSEQ